MKPSWEMLVAAIAVIWVSLGYLSAAIIYAYDRREYPNTSDLYGLCWTSMIYLPFGLTGIFAYAESGRKHGICWNWIVRPDLSAPKTQPSVPWPPTQRPGVNFPCLKCGIVTSDIPPGEPLCGMTHYVEYINAGGGLGVDEKKHRAAMKKVMGSAYIPPNPQTGLTVAQLRSAHAQLKVAATPYATFMIPHGSPLSATPAPAIPQSTSTTPIVGYRVWLLDRKKCILHSTFKTEYTWPFREKFVRSAVDNIGIHAAKDASALLSGAIPPGTTLPATPTLANPAGIATNAKGLWHAYRADVAGEVYLWGEVTEYERGYRAEFAYPKELWLPEDTDPTLVMKLEENYGVPVTLRKEFTKYAFPPPPPVCCVGCGAIIAPGGLSICAACLKNFFTPRYYPGAIVKL